MCNECKDNKYHKHVGLKITRRKMMKNILFGSAILLVPMSLFSKKAEAGNGSCYRCNCPAYVDGYNSTCARCGHSYSDHTIGGY